MTKSSSALNKYAEIINGLHEKWKPHPGQVPIGRALIQEGFNDIFVQAGRNFGKTELVAYLLWRWAKTFPGSENYYFGPYMKQAREILWASRRLQSFGPQEWLKGKPNDTEMRVVLDNDSFIKCDGSDNVEAYRGIKPKGLTIFDEFKDFRPEFYEAYDPNRAAFNSPLIIIGTPPDRECQFTEVAEAFQKNSKKKFFWAPTEQNPYISKDWLKAKKAELYARGEGDVWEREYMARFVKGGASKIFPMLSRDIVKTHDAIMAELFRDRKKLTWVLFADPAAATCFATLFLAVNPYSKKLYLLDEIYETDQAKMSVKQIGNRIQSIKKELFDYGEWRQGYDEAEKWFQTEMMDNFEEYFEPSLKSQNDKESGLTLIKDILLQGKLVMSDRCVKMFWELDNYYKDKKGKIPKVNDHLIDCFRYALGAVYYSLTQEKEYIEAEDENFRGARISDDFEHFDNWGRPRDEWEDF